MRFFPTKILWATLAHALAEAAHDQVREEDQKAAEAKEEIALAMLRIQ